MQVPDKNGEKSGKEKSGLENYSDLLLQNLAKNRKKGAGINLLNNSAVIPASEVSSPLSMATGSYNLVFWSIRWVICLRMH